MVKNSFFRHLFLEAIESLSDDERLEMVDLSRAAIKYEEVKRALFMGHIDKRINELRQEHALWTIDESASSGGGKQSLAEEGVEPAQPYEAEILRESEVCESTASDTEAKCGNATIGDIARCKGQRDAARIIGTLNPRGFALGQAAALIHGAGLSKGSPESVMSNLHKYMSTNDEWEKIGRSRFRLRRANAEIQEVELPSLHLKPEESDSPERNLEQVA